MKHPSALAAMAGALAATLAIAPPIDPSLWARQNLVIPDGPRLGELWNDDLTPYISEPLDMLAPDSGVNEIAVMKSAQTGFTTLMIAAIGHSIDRDPCRMMVLQPTDAALVDFNKEKLQPAIDETKVLAEKVADTAGRSAKSSNTYSKRYPGGSLTLAIASSAADLRSKTIKKLFRDEIDQYPEDLDGQGSPLEQSDARLIAFLASGDWKKVDVSTPTVKGGSAIEKRYLAGDQRRWHVPCSHCEGEFVFESGENFRFERNFPYKAHYIAPCCGSIIEGHEKNGLARRGRWIATDPRPGAFPSYHFDVFSSPFVPWDKIAAVIVAAGEDPTRLKALWNLWYGLPFEIKGEAPETELLLARREDLAPQGHVPAEGLMLVGAADVQMRGIWYQVIAYTPGRRSIVIAAGYLDGDTSAPNAGAFDLLRKEVLERRFPDAFGGTRGLDALAVDSGYRSHVVYSWVRNYQRPHPDTGKDLIFAVKGADGWGIPALGMPNLVDINLDGRKVKKGAKVYLVGTWPLKGAFYAELRKQGRRQGAEIDPEGYCYFGTWLDQAYFDQITSEYLAEEKFRGRIRKVWKPRPSRPDNHLLDCRIYCDALAEYLGLSSMTREEWAALARHRGMAEAMIETDLFTPRAPIVPPQPLPRPAHAQAPASQAAASTSVEVAAPPSSFLPRRNGWLHKG